MLTTHRFNRLMAQFRNLPPGQRLEESGEALVRKVREGDPARTVFGGSVSSAGDFQATKMTGLTIQYESRRPENAACYAYERDHDVLEFWDQPAAVPIAFQTKAGGAYYRDVYPDFLVIRSDGVYFDDWKREELLARESGRANTDIVRLDAGGYDRPRRAEAAAKLGIRYRLRSLAELSPTYIRNIRFLEAWWRDPRGREPMQVPSDTAQKAILDVVWAHPGVRQPQLLQSIEETAAPSDLYWMLARNRIFTDLYAAFINSWECRVFPNRQVFEAAGFLDRQILADRLPVSVYSIRAGTEVTLDGRRWKVASITSETVFLQLWEGKPSPAESTWNPSNLARPQGQP